MTPTPREGNSGIKGVKLLDFLKNRLVYSGACFRQTKCIIMVIEEGFIKIVKFITPGAKVLVQERGHISHKLKMHHLKKGLLYTQA